MAETNAPPTEQELLAYRSDLADYLPTGKTLSDIMALALSDVKRYLEDNRGITWVSVFDTTNDEYFQDPDGNDRNKDRIQHAIKLMTISILFRDYATIHGGAWWELYISFRADAEDLLKNASLDIDLDESGGITEDEVMATGQRFLTK